MSTTRIVVCIGSLIIGSLCGVTGSMICAKMQGAVNQRLPELEHFEAPWWFGNLLGIMREHRRLFPRSKARTIQYSLAAMMFTCLAGLAFAIGIL
jgi:hypothetical protein